MPSICGRSIRGAAAALALLTFGLPAAASAAGSTSTPRRTVLPPQFQVPASARVHGASTSPASAAHGALPSSSAQSGVPASARATTPTTATAPSLAPGAKAATPTTVPATPTTVPVAPTTVPATPTTVPVAPAAGVPAKTARPTATGSKRLSTAAIVAAALAALLIVVCLAWGAARWWAYEPHWTVTLRHSLAEAGWRLSATWDEFADWARLGR